MRIRHSITGAALALMMVAGSAAYAQTTDQQSGTQEQPQQGHMEHRGRRGGPGMMDPEQHLRMLTKQLNLTEDQQAKIKPILEASHEKAQQLRESHKPQQGANGEAAQPPSREERQEMRKQMEQIHNDTISQVRAQLTPDQQTKFDQLVANMNQHEREGMRHRRGNEGGNGENPPPQQPQ